MAGRVEQTQAIPMTAEERRADADRRVNELTLLVMELEKQLRQARADERRARADLARR